ncbi:hypothetical protein J4407_02915 [Candidatus Pacearchaeota archaeon]|nr:hypothetical protein [Candidatus Pacearchaeota archaeon]
MNKKNKKAQEEMVGFALIIIVVSIILMIFLAFYLNREPKKETVESYEAESFTQAFLQYTTSCTDNFEFLNVQDVIYECDIRNTCANGEDPCEVLERNLKGILGESWNVKTGSPVKGYELNIVSSKWVILNISEGQKTVNSKGSAQYLPKDVDIYFVAYY